jgi:hypothetical protein
MQASEVRFVSDILSLVFPSLGEVEGRDVMTMAAIMMKVGRMQVRL